MAGIELRYAYLDTAGGATALPLANARAPRGDSTHRQRTRATRPPLPGTAAPAVASPNEDRYTA